MMMRSGFSMNRDITPSSPHPLSKVVDAATAATKNPSDHAIGNPEAEGEVERDTSTLSCVPINCEPVLTVAGDATFLAAGLCKTVLITHGESGRSGVGRTRNVTAPTSLAGQFEQPYGPMGPPTLFTIPVLRYMKTYGLTHEQLAMVSVVQREWTAKNPRATFRTPITVEDVLNSRMIAYPFRLLQCCLVTDGAGALILVAAERARDFPQKPVYLLGTGESVETPMVSQMEDFTSSRAFRVAGPKAFAEAGITHNDVDHLMIYDAFAHLPIYGLEDLGFVPR